MEMPPVLVEWGCDEELWSKVRAKKELVNAATAGDEAVGRRLVERLQKAVVKEANRPPKPQNEKPSKPQAPSKPPARALGKSARPLKDGYTLAGEPPAGCDVAAVEKLLAERVEAKLSKNYDVADRLQAELGSMGVFCNDRQRTWSAKAD